MSSKLPLETILHVRDTCLCFATQRAARVLARHFDGAFRPLGITNTQFSLMMMLSAPQPPLLTRLGPALGMDRTTVTAALKGLERSGLARIDRDENDKRGRRPSLTAKGQDVLAAALPIWKAEHARVEACVPGLDATSLRHQLALAASLNLTSEAKGDAP